MTSMWPQVGAQPAGTCDVLASMLDLVQRSTTTIRQACGAIHASDVQQPALPLATSPAVMGKNQRRNHRLRLQK